MPQAMQGDPARLTLRLIAAHSCTPCTHLTLAQDSLPSRTDSSDMRSRAFGEEFW